MELFRYIGVCVCVCVCVIVYSLYRIIAYWINADHILSKGYDFEAVTRR